MLLDYLGITEVLGDAMGLGADGIYHPDPSHRQQNRRIRESEIAGWRAAGSASERSYAIARLRRSEKLEECLAAMLERKSSILETMSQNWLRRRWREQLDGIDLTSPGAEDELNRLIQDVHGTRNLYGGDLPRSDPPSWWVTATESALQVSAPPLGSGAFEDWEQIWTSSPLGAEMQAKEEGRKAALEQAANDLASLESSLGVLLSDVRMYAHYRDLSLEIYLSM